MAQTISRPTRVPEWVPALLMILMLAGLPLAVWLDLRAISEKTLRLQADDLNSVITSVRDYYATNVVGVSTAQYGALVAIQMATAIVVYIPAARIADRVGRKPFVVATFICFALFPIAVAFATGFWTLAGAFVLGGLREIGEPSRKAMIVDFAEPHLRARSVGLYYLVRSLSITPAAAIGGALYTLAPRAPFLLAGAIGLVGVAVFTMTVDERYAG